MQPSALTLPDTESLAALRARHPIALFLDFDGTLVEIAERPDAIRIPDTLGADLEKAAEALNGRLAVVSGRPLAELRSFLGHSRVALAGSHGMELRDASGQPIACHRMALDDAAALAIRHFADISPDLLLEEKPFGLALHYRTAPARGADVLHFAEALARIHPVALKRGKCVVEFVVPGASKRSAVERLMAAPPFDGAVPVFVGDDETDEDGFAAAAELGGWGIAVGERLSRNAAYRLETPAAVRDWMKRGI